MHMKWVQKRRDEMRQKRIHCVNEMDANEMSAKKREMSAKKREMNAYKVSANKREMSA